MNRWLIAVVLGCMATGCSHLRPEEVKPWQRDVMAREDMQPYLGDKAQMLIDEHIYFSKEAATGGDSVGGGGCGCN